MIIVRLENGIEINTSGGLRVLEVKGGFYVVGEDMLISVNSHQEGLDEIRKYKENAC